MKSMMTKCRTGLLVLVFSLIAGCGGGGGSGGNGGSSNSGPTLSVTTPSLTFTAAKPSSAIPAVQTISATVNGTIQATNLFVRIEVSNPEVISVSNVVVNGNSGEATVTPFSPARLGVGTHTATIRVIACTTDQTCATGQLAGSPQTINVSYQVGSNVERETLMPDVAITSRPGRVVLRGRGLTGTTGVRFGSTAATAVSVVSDTEVVAEYSSLPPGVHAVTLDRGGASIPFGATFSIVTPRSDVATFVPYASPGRQVMRMIYDARRQALLVALDRRVAADHEILRFAYSQGVWNAPTVYGVPNLRDIALAPGGQELLVATDNTISKVDPTTLSVISSANKPSGESGAIEFIKGITLANDGTAHITTGYGSGSGSTRLYVYSLQDQSFTYPRLIGSANFATNRLWYGSGSASADGSRVMFVEALYPGTPMLEFSPSTGRYTSGVSVQHAAMSASENLNAPSFDEHATRLLLPRGMGSGIPYEYTVYDGAMTRLGYVPASTRAFAVARFNNAVFTFEDDPVCRIRRFDVTNGPAGAGEFPEFTSNFPRGVPCPNAQGAFSFIQATMSPDGNTLFLAGSGGVVIEPAY